MNTKIMWFVFNLATAWGSWWLTVNLPEPWDFVYVLFIGIAAVIWAKVQNRNSRRRMEARK